MGIRTDSTIGAKALTKRQDVFARSFTGRMGIKGFARKANNAEKDLVKARQSQPQCIRLKASEPIGNCDLAAEEFIRYHLIPRLYATKKRSIRLKGGVRQVFEVPDNKARLSAVCKLLWLMGALPSPYTKPVKPKHIEYGASGLPQSDR